MGTVGSLASAEEIMRSPRRMAVRAAA